MAEGGLRLEVGRKKGVIRNQKCEIEELNRQNLEAEGKIGGLRDDVSSGKR